MPQATSPSPLPSGEALSRASRPVLFPALVAAAVAGELFLATGAVRWAAIGLLVFAAGFAALSRPALRARHALVNAGLARTLTLASAVILFCDGLLGALLRQVSLSFAAADVRLFHRVGAIGLAGLVMASSVATFLSAVRQPWLRRLALLPPLLVGAQALLGASPGAGHPGSLVAETHLAVGPLLLGIELAILFLTSPEAGALGGWRVGSWGALARALVELTKPRVTFLVVVTFAGGVWLAPGRVSWLRAGLALLGTVLIVGAANALNMYLERDVDGLMRRTSRRPLPEGRLPAEAAVIVGVALASVATPLLFLAGNALVGWLGLFAFGSYVWMYTPLKRRSPVALWVGAVPGAMPPLMGWAMGTARLDAGGLTLFAVLFLWQIPHFLAIAIYRGEEYARAGFRVMSLGERPIAMRVHMVLFTSATVISTLLLYKLRVTGLPFLITAALLGAGFLRKAMPALGTFPSREALLRWARSLFFFSIVYLMVLFVALAADKLLQPFWG